MLVEKWLVGTKDQKYTQVIKEFVDSLTPQVSGTWHADETLLNIKGTEPMGKGLYSYAWACMDSQTRFLLACEISKHLYASDGTKMFKKAEQVAKSKPMSIITDSYSGYNDAINGAFWTMAKPRPIQSRPKRSSMVWITLGWKGILENSRTEQRV